MLVRTRLLEVVAAVRPGALIADRSATLGGRPTSDNLLFLVHETQPDVTLPGGIVLRSRRGAGPLPSDLELPYGLHMSGEARCALENMVASRSRGGRTSRTLSRHELELWLDRQVSSRGDDWARRLRAEIEELAPILGLEREAATLDGLIGALLGTRRVAVVPSELAARMRRAAFDSARVDHNRPVAELGPPVSTGAALDRLIAEGNGSPRRVTVHPPPSGFVGRDIVRCSAHGRQGSRRERRR